MSLNIQDSKMQQKLVTIPGIEPTMGTSSDYTDGSWLDTDIYQGELFVNIADERIWFIGEEYPGL